MRKVCESYGIGGPVATKPKGRFRPETGPGGEVLRVCRFCDSRIVVNRFSLSAQSAGSTASAPRISARNHRIGTDNDRPETAPYGHRHRPGARYRNDEPRFGGQRRLARERPARLRAGRHSSRARHATAMLCPHSRSSNHLRGDRRDPGAGKNTPTGN